MWQVIGEAIGAATGKRFVAQSCRPIGGGCINSVFLVEDGANRFFVKVNHVSRLAMFEAEADGLREILSVDTIRVPFPVCVGVAETSSFLVLEYIEFGAGRGGNDDELGYRLAKLHQVGAQQHGWWRDNTIGSTPQVNNASNHWPEFFRARRLGYQLNLAAENGFGGILQRDGERLLAKIEGLFVGYSPAPSLLHGDLWGGNYAYARDGEPVVFDPAVYYGDRETDMAMTELFGGFSVKFFAAYNEAFPLDAGYLARKNLYNLYHVLNHLNMFGGAYLGQAEGMIERLLAEVG